MKHATACAPCRAAKKKCLRRPGELNCAYCRLHGLTSKCSNPPQNAPSAISRPLKPAVVGFESLSPEENNLLTVRTRLELVDLYILYIHDRPHSLFHAPTLRRHVEAEEISEALLLALCSLGCRFSKLDSLRSLGATLTRASKIALHVTLANKDTQVVQACILVANLCAANLDPDGEALYFGFAICLARVMKLHESCNKGDDAVTREVHCRIWWSLFMADRWCSAGSSLPRQMSSDSIGKVRLPVEEHVFQHEGFKKSRSSESARPGLWAYKTTLVRILGHIQDLHHQVVDGTTTQAQTDERVSELADSLDEWESEIPDSYRYSDENLQTHRDKGFGGVFIDMHLGYHYYAALLFFIYLDVKRPPSPATTDYPSRCKDHALRYSKLLAISRTTSRCEAVHATVGHMTVVSSAVLIHTLLFEEESKRGESRDGLLSNFESLLQLQKLWPSMTSLISRLFQFQHACLTSVDDHTHRMNGWMSHFLLEYNPNPETSETTKQDLEQLLQV